MNLIERLIGKTAEHDNPEEILALHDAIKDLPKRAEKARAEVAAETARLDAEKAELADLVERAHPTLLHDANAKDVAALVKIERQAREIIARIEARTKAQAALAMRARSLAARLDVPVVAGPLAGYSGVVCRAIAVARLKEGATDYQDVSGWLTPAWAAASAARAQR